MENDYDLNSEYTKLANIISSAVSFKIYDKVSFNSKSKRSEFNFHIHKFNSLIERWKSYHISTVKKMKRLNKLFVQAGNDRNKLLRNIDKKFDLLKSANNELSFLENARSQIDYAFSKVVNKKIDAVKTELNSAIVKQRDLIDCIKSMLNGIAETVYPKPLSDKSEINKRLEKMLSNEFKKIRKIIGDDNILQLSNEKNLLIDTNKNKLVFGKFIPILNVPKLKNKASLLKKIYLVSIVELDDNNKYSKTMITFSLTKTSPKKLLLSSQGFNVDNPKALKKSILKLSSTYGYLMFQRQFEE